MNTKATGFLLGVDTGGTYTDAAIVDAGSHRVIASAKALTTRGDLAIGVCEAMRRSLDAMPEGTAGQIRLVSVSTTLATNAVVEGHGSPACVVLIGFDETMIARSGLTSAFPGMIVEQVAGGHDHNGDEAEKLDEAALREVVARTSGKVEAFAVASKFAVRNPAHEHTARNVLSGESGLPVTISTELASELDAPRRALTAALNARLISRISQLIAAVETGMGEFGIDAPLMITKGDGSLARAEQVALRPIETVLSGPAASIVGAASLSGLNDFILSDMGGTTTDLGVFEKGRPHVNAQGADVGGWRTMVQAIDVRTLGLGGDSEVSFNVRGEPAIGPGRSVPVSLLASRFPDITKQLEQQLSDPETSSLAGRFVMLPLGKAGQGKAGLAGLNGREAELLACIGAEPVALARVAASSAAQRTLNGLVRKGYVQTAGFTPSDAAHVLALQDNWPGDAALLAAKLLVRFVLMRAPTQELAEQISRSVWEETVRLSGRAVLETALGHHAIEQGQTGGLVDVVCRGEGRRALAKVSISPEVPVVAVGGPVRVYYPEAGRRLGCEVVFCDAYEVANAVGAATGRIASRIDIEVNGNGSGVFRVHGPDAVEQFGRAAQALERALQLAHDAAVQAVANMGGANPKLAEHVEKSLLPDAVNDDGLLRALVRVEAVASPVD